MDVKLKKESRKIPTYIPKKPLELPMFFENKPYQGASGRLYPLPFADGITDKKEDVPYEVYSLENEYVKTEVLPALGGKILRGLDKTNNYDFIYYNEVVKPALVGLAGPWTSGGIEFNWPQHHRPTTYMPLEVKTEENPDGSKTIWVGEVEPFARMKGMAGITLEKGRSYIKAKVKIYNRTPEKQVFMWWANLAVPVNEHYRTVFPPDVEWINDHDRRCVMSWPIAKGVYHTARPFNYGEGTDISRYSAVKVPSSFLVAEGQSDMDFVSGYDEGKKAGIVTVADHHISPGKKMWDWGKGDFGEMWCNNLTDKNGPYIELMTGVYTDNQPDFSWIAPYETREFEQVWYPVRGIGCVKNATVDAALNSEMHDGKLFVGICVTGTFKGSRLVITGKNGVLASKKLDLTPDMSYTEEFDIGKNKYEDITVTLLSAEGKVLVSYKTYIRGNKKPITPRQPVKRPSEIDSNEELFINGIHLEQYKQHNYAPEAYYTEALSRDPGDIRCNTGMARLSLKYGSFDKAVSYADKALERLLSRNTHPYDTEAFYIKGMALKYLGKDEEAFDALSKAAWDFRWRCAALYELGCLEMKSGNYVGAIEKFDTSASLSGNHNLAKLMKAICLRLLGNTDTAKIIVSEVLAADCLEILAYTEGEKLKLVKKKEIEALFGKKPENFIDAASAYMSAGLYADASAALSLCSTEYPLFGYYKAYCAEMQGDNGKTEAKNLVQSSEKTPLGLCFPSRNGDIAVLSFAARKKNTPNAKYLLGCLYYDRKRYAEALSLWESAVSEKPDFAFAYRNMALCYFDKKGDFESARLCLEKARRYAPENSRIFFEYQQLLKNTNVSPAKRLEVFEEAGDVGIERDDCYLERITLESLVGNYETAIEMAKGRRFHIYEGGEGKLTKLHAWMHVLFAAEKLGEGKLSEAETILENGVNMPKSYGEAKTFFNQEGHIYYLLGIIAEKNGKDGRAFFEKGAEYKAAVSEISLFRALSLRKLDRFTEGYEVLEEMLETGRNKLENADLRTYYGVGSPSPMPFEYDILKQNRVDGSILCAYALLGLGKLEKAQNAMNIARKLSPCDMRVVTFDKTVEFLKF